MPYLKPSTTEKLLSRTCGWCGLDMPYSGKGRPPAYCCKAHRNRAWEVRSAVARQADAQDAGTAAAGPVREVVERTVTVEKTRVVVKQGPPKIPASATDWCSALDQLGAQLRDGKLGREHWNHRKLLAALTDVSIALDRAHPGGLDNLTHRR